MPNQNLVIAPWPMPGMRPVGKSLAQRIIRGAAFSIVYRAESVIGSFVNWS